MSLPAKRRQGDWSAAYVVLRISPCSPANRQRADAANQDGITRTGLIVVPAIVADAASLIFSNG
jgi:hypothetical protein